MPRLLPLRWTPAASMWTRGDTVEDIAAMYGTSPRSMEGYIAYLRENYPDTFPLRTSAAVVMVPVRRLMARVTLRAKVIAPVQGTNRVQAFAPKAATREPVSLKASARIPSPFSGQVRHKTIRKAPGARTPVPLRKLIGA